MHLKRVVLWLGLLGAVASCEQMCRCNLRSTDIWLVDCPTTMTVGEVWDASSGGPVMLEWGEAVSDLIVDRWATTQQVGDELQEVEGFIEFLDADGEPITEPGRRTEASLRAVGPGTVEVRAWVSFENLNHNRAETEKWTSSCEITIVPAAVGDGDADVDADGDVDGEVDGDADGVADAEADVDADGGPPSMLPLGDWELHYTCSTGEGGLEYPSFAWGGDAWEITVEEDYLPDEPFRGIATSETRVDYRVNYADTFPGCEQGFIDFSPDEETFCKYSAFSTDLVSGTCTGFGRRPGSTTTPPTCPDLPAPEIPTCPLTLY